MASRASNSTCNRPPAAAESLQADYVLVAIGRRPYTEGLGLETVGLASDRRGMLENQGQRSAAPGVWVIGDVTSGPMLAHKAEEEAIVCIERIAGHAAEMNAEVIPSVIYTQPEVASVGLGEQLRRRGASTRSDASRSAPTAGRRSTTRAKASSRSSPMPAATRCSACT